MCKRSTSLADPTERQLDSQKLYRVSLFSLHLRIHIEEINHTVLMHMTEKMGYKHSEVLSAVLTNRACHTLAVYFLLNSKMQRLSKEYRVSVCMHGT